MLKQSMRLACLVLAALFAGAAHAEEGDYSSLQTLWNLAFPPGPDNPVRSSETTLESRRSGSASWPRPTSTA